MIRPYGAGRPLGKKSVVSKKNSRKRVKPVPLIISRPKAALKKHRVQIVFVCAYGRRSSRRFAEALRAYINLRKDKNLSGIDIKFGGPMASNTNIEAIMGADFIYSVFPRKELAEYYRMHERVNITPFLNKAQHFGIIDDITLLRVSQEKPPEVIAKSLSDYFSTILYDVEAFLKKPKKKA